MSVYDIDYDDAIPKITDTSSDYESYSHNPAISSQIPDAPVVVDIPIAIPAVVVETEEQAKIRLKKEDDMYSMAVFALSCAFGMLLLSSIVYGLCQDRCDQPYVVGSLIVLILSASGIGALVFCLFGMYCLRNVCN